MVKILFCGDVHATPEELDDCWALVRLIGDIAIKNGKPVVCFLGDSFHTHAIIHMEVMGFWKKAFEYLRNTGLEVMALVGNHDISGESSSKVHAMMPYSEQITVIRDSLFKYGIQFVGYQQDQEKFLQLARENPQAGTLVCHQTFKGSQYDNNFYAPDGIDPNLILQKEVISGHIHKPQQFGKIWYVGSPRWRTLSDANIERAIWLVHHDENGSILEKQAFTTGETCKQIRYLLDTPENPISIQLDPRHSWRIDIQGPQDYIERRKAELAGPGVRLRTFKTENSVVKVRESQGIEIAFKHYFDQYRPKFSTLKEKLQKMIEERL